jgi:hypothetical protein
LAVIDPILYQPPRIWHWQAKKNRTGQKPRLGRMWD